MVVPATAQSRGRYFFRDGDFDAPPWRAVRAAATPSPPAAAAWCGDLLDRLLRPGPDGGPADKLKGAGGASSLTGLALWASEHL
jgi:hypothetical protein